MKFINVKMIEEVQGLVLSEKEIAVNIEDIVTVEKQVLSVESSEEVVTHCRIYLRNGKIIQTVESYEDVMQIISNQKKQDGKNHQDGKHYKKIVSALKSIDETLIMRL